MAIVQIGNYSFAYPQANSENEQAGVSVCSDGLPPAADHPPVPSASAPRVLDNVSLSVEEGAFCVIVGATGCGKTTLLKSLKPELAPAGVRAGSVRVCGRDVVCNGEVAQGMSQRESAENIGFVMQDPALQIVCDTVWHELAFGLENLGMPQEEMRRRVAEVAHFFGMEPWIRANVEDLSGGQKQLVNLAAALALRPKLLLLDEPTAQLDPHAVKQFLFMLARINRELGVTVVVTTHAPEDMELYVTQRIDLGETVPLAARAQAEGRLCGRWAQRADVLRNAPACLRVHEAFFRYDRKASWVLRGIDLDVSRGSVHALVGGNGCGKTTLLKLMAGVFKPQRGRVSNDFALSQALLPQDPKALFVCDSVIEELREWQGRCGYEETDVRRALERFGLARHAGHHPYDLSGGQQQKLAFAKLLLCKPSLLFLDEPTKGLDPASCAEASRIVRDLADEGCTVVFVTHDLDFALVTADRVSMLFDGEIACTEPVGEFFANNLVYRPNASSRLFGVVAHES